MIDLDNNQISIDGSVFDIPKLEAVQTGEKVRVWLPVASVEMRYRHTIQDKATSGGGAFNKASWGGYVICLGEDAALQSPSGADPTNCSLCRMALEGNQWVEKAKRKFAAWVLRYSTDPSGMNVFQPVGVQLLTWLFSDGEYRLLKDSHQMYSAQGGITAVDLLLTSKKKEFKTWEFLVNPTCAWRQAASADPRVAEMVGQVLAPAADPEHAGKLRALVQLIGKTMTNAEAEQYVLDTTRGAANQALGEPAAQQPSGVMSPQVMASFMMPVAAPQMPAVQMPPQMPAVQMPLPMPTMPVPAPPQTSPAMPVPAPSIPQAPVMQVAPTQTPIDLSALLLPPPPPSS